MDKHYDVVIIGAGPAGLSAAIYAARAGKAVVILERLSVGGQMGMIADISNYPGFSKIDGMTLASSMMSQAESLGALIQYDSAVRIEHGKPHRIITSSDTVYTAPNIIIATGVRAKKLGIDREDELVGSGVSYCAECDGNFFKGKIVAVVGNGKKAATEALYLSVLCQKVFVISNKLILTPALQSKIDSAGNIEVISDSIIELSGSPLDKLILKSGNSLAVSGLFVALGATSETTLLNSIGLKTDERGFVITDDSMNTNIIGISAAGDIRSRSLRQIVTACADGATAAIKLPK